MNAGGAVAGRCAVAHGEADSARAARAAPHNETVDVIVKLNVAERDPRGGRAQSEDEDSDIQHGCSVFGDNAVRYVKLASDTGRHRHVEFR